MKKHAIKKIAPPPPPSPEELERRAADDAAMQRGMEAARALFRPQARVYTHPHKVYDIHKHTYEIPTFQRGYVWTPDQAIAMMRRLFLGMPLGQIMVWEQPHPKPPMLLDGQQRLVTLGAKVFRDGVPVVGHTVYIDWTARSLDNILTCEPGPTRVTLAQMDRVYRIPGFRTLDVETQVFLTEISEHISNADVACTTVGPWFGAPCTFEQAAQIFRCYNSGGTPIDPDELPPEPVL